MKEFLHKYGEDMKDLEIESLRQKLAEWDEKAKNWMASPEARKRLAGYRSMGAMCAELEDNRDQLRRQLSNALAANEQNLKVYHAAAELLRQQLAAAETRLEGVKQQRDVERVSYLNEFDKNQVLIQQLADSQKQNVALKEALIGWRQRAFPGTDQRIVIERDFPTVVRPSVS